jgi:mRNA interferase RelE/StbE
LTASNATQGLHKYRLKFLPEALDEWNALDGSIKTILRNALKKRLDEPRLPGSRLHGDLHDCYKIKLRKQGYRLIYCVEDDVLIVLVLAIDKRENLPEVFTKLAV